MASRPRIIENVLDVLEPVVRESQVSVTRRHGLVEVRNVGGHVHHLQHLVSGGQETGEPQGHDATLVQVRSRRPFNRQKSPQRCLW